MFRLLIADAGRVPASARLPSGREMRRYLVAALLASLPCLALAIFYQGGRVGVHAAVTFCAALAVETVFAAVRRRRVNGSALPFSSSPRRTT